MNTRINSVSELLKIFLLTAFSFIAIIILFPQSVQARLVMKTTSDGFTLNGNVTYDPEDDDSLYHNFNYNINTESRSMDYTYQLSITFPSLELSPESVIIDLDDEVHTSLYNNGSNVFSSKGDFHAYDSIDCLEMDFSYNSYDMPKVNIQISFTVREKRKQPDVTISFADTHYEGDTDTLRILIQDPYVNSFMDLDISKLSVSFADPSIASLAGSPIVTNYDVTYYVYLKKRGSTEITAKYGSKTVKKKFSVLQSVAYVPEMATIEVGKNTTLASFITIYGGGSVNITKIKSSDKNVLAVSGKYLLPKKPGTAIITALYNGKKHTTLFTVYKNISKPTVNQLKVSVTKYNYYPSSQKTYFYVKFTNKSAYPLTKAKLKFTTSGNEDVILTQSFKGTLKPGKTKTLKIYVGKMPDTPKKIRVKCQKFWYKK